MNAALRCGAILPFRRWRRFRVLAVRLRRHVQKPPHDALHAPTYLLIRLVVKL